MRKFSRTMGRRRTFMESLAYSLVMYGRIETTPARAKEVRPFVERLVTAAKKQNVAALRLLLARVSKPAANKLYYEIGPRYASRQGGYLRVTKLTQVRKRDGSPKAVIEFV